MSILGVESFPIVPDRVGWPWDTETDPKLYEWIKVWPKITIITPSFNQANFLEETIRSVILQNYPNLEYIIIDGGSTDNSIDIIKRYDKYITYWVSEKDFGQSHAINKGIFISTGELINWINSDDILLKDSCYHIGKKYCEAANDRVVLIGHGYEIDENSKVIRERRVKKDYSGINNFSISGLPIQQSFFVSKRILTEAGGINPLLKYVMDIELQSKINFLKPVVIISDNYLACFRKHLNSKTISQNFLMMVEKISLLRFLSFYDLDNEYYNIRIVAYILGTSFENVSMHEKLKYLFFAFKMIPMKRKNIYKYRILANKIFD